MPGRTPSLLLTLACLLALALVTGSARASGDQVPRADLDRPVPAREVEPVASRARWMIRPDDPVASLSVLGQRGAELVARIARLDDLWILEAPADSAARVEQLWSGRGALLRDVSGDAALLQSTRLIGARGQVWDAYGLRGDVTSSVAILDSGCDTAHDDLGDPDTDDEDAPPLAGDEADWSDAVAGVSGDPQIRVIGWHDVTDDLPQAKGPWDYHYHGTALAGAAFGGGELSDDHQGVAPRGRVVVVKTWNFEDRWERWASDLLLGLEWVIEHAATYRIRAVLIATVWSADLGFSDSIDTLASMGIAVVAAAGNDRAEVGYPARLAGVISVGATDDFGRVTRYSAPAAADEPAGTLDLVAPGGSVDAVNGLIEVPDNEPDDSYRGRVGTSLAAAHVAGAVSLISEALVESGRAWRADAAQVQWLNDVLRATAVELGVTEPGAATPARLDRGGADRAEGWGLLQVPAAIDVVRRVLWPGNEASFALGAPHDGPAVWACRLITAGGRPLDFTLAVPATGDFDLHVFEERDDGLLLVGRSNAARSGGTERVRVEHPRTDACVVVVRRVSGEGLAQLQTQVELLGEQSWPNALRSAQRGSPAVADLDGDGTSEIVVVNNAENDPTVHNFNVWNADGTTYGFFPITVFSSGRPGELSTPAIGRLGDQTAIVVGSAFGEVYAVRPSAELRWARTVGAGATSSPMIVPTAAGARVVVGTPTGVALLDEAGTIVRTIAAGGAVSQAPAAGDLDGDAVPEIVFADVTGRVHATGLDGSARPGWPVNLGGVCMAPVLRGDGDGGPVREIVVVQRDGSSRLFVHRLQPDGVAVNGSPIALTTGPDAVLAQSTPALAPLERGATPSIVVSALSGGILSSLRSWRFVVDANGVVSAQQTVIAESVLTSTFVSIGSLLLGEPRIVDVYGTDAREIVTTARATWSMFRGIDVLRTGGFAGSIVWDANGARTVVPVTADRDRAGTAGVVAPVFADLDGDRRPEWIVARDREVQVIGSRLPDDLSTTWNAERGSPDRRACVGCEAQTVVSATPAAGRMTLRAVPNPFNPRTRLRASVPGEGEVRFEVYDLRGRRLREWSVTVAGAGVIESDFDALDLEGRPLASGLYLAAARWQDQRDVTRLVLVR